MQNKNQGMITYLAYLKLFPKVSLAFIFFFIALIVFFCFYSPHVPVAAGLGWDGQIYGKCAIDLPTCFQSRTLSTYTLERLFPSTLIYAAFSLLKITAKPALVVQAFAIWNLFAIGSSLLLWIDSARRQEWKTDTAFFGIVALFFCFAVIRLPFYAPVSTDVTALFFASLAMWCFAADKSWLCLILILPAGFTWPIAIPVLLCLVALKGTERTEQQRQPSHLLPILCVLIYLSAVAYYLLISPQLMPYGAAQIAYKIIPTSLFLSSVYVYWAAQGLGIVSAFRNFSLNPLAFVASMAVLGLYLVAHIALKPYAALGNPMNPGILLRGLTVTGLVYPGLFLVAHVVFLGPWILIFLALIPRIMARVAIPLYPILALVLIFFLLTESRGMTFFLPFAVYSLCSILDQSLTRGQVYLFAVISLILSHFWLPMETGPFSNLLEFPAQILFMHIGPWMNKLTYFFGILELLVAATFFFWFFSALSRSGTSRISYVFSTLFKQYPKKFALSILKLNNQSSR